MLAANIEMARKAASRSRSALVPMRKVKWGGTAKKSRQAVETSEQKTAGPKPRKRAVKSTAASKSTKRWRCSAAESVQQLSATHTASAAPKYCTSAEYRFRAIQFSRLAKISDIFKNAAGSTSGRTAVGSCGQECFRCAEKTLAADRGVLQPPRRIRLAGESERGESERNADPVRRSRFRPRSQVSACGETCNRGWRPPARKRLRYCQPRPSPESASPGKVHCCSFGRRFLRASRRSVPLAHSRAVAAGR